MPLTNPNDFPQGGGIDPRDENHPMFPKKPSLRVFLKPLSQKVIEKNLWIEVVAVLLVIFVGFGELIGRQLSSGFYFALGIVLTPLLWRFIHIEDETHQKVMTPPEQKTDEPK